MPFDPSGNFTRVMNWQQDRDNGIRILADRHDAEDDNFAAAFNQVFLRGGIVPMTGDLNMGGYNINTIKAGSAAAPSLTWELDPDTGFYQPAPDSIAFSSNGLESVRFKNTGVQIRSADALVEFFSADGATRKGYLYATGTNMILKNDQDGPFNYAAGQHTWTIGALGEKMRIDAAGNVGIGITTPNAKLVVDGDLGTLKAAGFYAYAAGSEFVTISGVPTATYGMTVAAAYTSFAGDGAGTGLSGFAGISFFTSSAEQMTIRRSGNVGIGTTNPGSKLEVAGEVRISSAQPVANSSIVLFQPSALGSDGTNIVVSYYGSGGYGPLMLHTGGSEKMRITPAGSVGIGINAPPDKLSVDGNIGVNKAGGGMVGYSPTGDNSTISGQQTPSYGMSVAKQYNGFIGPGTGLSGYYGIMFATAGLERMRIWDTGGVCINTTAQNNQGLAMTLAMQTMAGRYGMGIKPTTDGIYYHSFSNQADGACGSISQPTPTSTAYNTTSDERLKENIAPATQATGALIDAIQIREFKWKGYEHTTRFGTIAQELELVCPEAVQPPLDENAHYGVDYSKLVPMLIKEIQDLRARLAAGGL